MGQHPRFSAPELDLRTSGLDVWEGNPYTMDIWRGTDLFGAG